MWKDSETELDFLDYNYLIKSVEGIVFDDNLLPASIGIYGDWGSGKSSLMQMCKTSIQVRDPQAKCIMFNGWLFENYDDAKSAILGTILDEINSEKTLTTKAKDIIKGLYKSIDKIKLAKGVVTTSVDFLITGGLGTLINIFTKSLKGSILEEKALENVKNELDMKELRENIRGFQVQFSELIEESKISRLVVFIDELDRCRPDTILDTLEAMKLFMFTGKVVFIIGADERHISYAVKSKFENIEGIQIDIGKEYLEKLIQYPIRIPRLNSSEVEIYIGCLLLQSEMENEIFDTIITELNNLRSDDFEKLSFSSVKDKITLNSEQEVLFDECVSIAAQLCSVLSNGLHGNPRQCKRFLNTLDMRMKMASYKNKTLDRRILAKIMMLEYIRPALFNKFNELLINGDLEQELINFENESKEFAEKHCEKLKIWLQDDWVINWKNIQPKLSGEDLRLYFYFTRTSLDEKISRISSSLSPQAKDILDKLYSKSDAQTTSAIELSGNISSSEASKILEALITKMQSETKIEAKRMKALFLFVEKRTELVTSLISQLDSFSGEQIQAGGMTYISQFAKNLDVVSDVKPIVEKWSKKSNSLLQLFENGLK